MPDLIQYTLVPGRNDLQVRAILDAHLAYEHTKSARQFWVHILAFLGGLIALCTLGSRFVPPDVNDILLSIWSTCCVGVILLAISELRWYRRASRLLAEQKEP